MKAMCAWYSLFPIVNHVSTRRILNRVGEKVRPVGHLVALNSSLARAPTSLPGPAALRRVFHSLWVMLTIPGCKQRSTSDFFHHAQHPTTKPSRRPHEPSHLAASDFRVHIDFYPPLPGPFTPATAFRTRRPSPE